MAQQMMVLPVERVASFSERCDGCNQLAQLLAELKRGGRVLLCGHHANLSYHGLQEQAARVWLANGFSWAPVRR